MAIQDSITREYLKLVYDDCYIRGDNVFATYSKYLSPEMRQKEKERLPYFNNIIQSIMAKRAELENQLNLFYGENREVTAELVEKLKQNNQQFLIVWSEYTKISSILPTVENLFYVYSGVQDDRNINNIDFEKWGINRLYIEDPIVISSRSTVNCGRYNGESVNITMFYNYLKPLMLNSMIDC